MDAAAAPISELSKRQLKHVLHGLGVATAGPRTELLERLRETVPPASAWRLAQGQADLVAADPRHLPVPELLDAQGSVLDLASFKLEDRVVEESEPQRVDAAALFPRCKVVRCGHEAKREGKLSPRIRAGVQPGSTGAGRRRVGERLLELMRQAGVSLRGETPAVVVVLGACGTGKSALVDCVREAEALGARCEPEWDANKALISQFGVFDAGVNRLMAVGLTSIPSWCKPYHILSTGERYRADMAKHLEHAEARGEPLVLDDFTSHLDRCSARACSAALGREARRARRGCLVATSCEDIVPWMQPDVVIACDAGDGGRLVRVREPLRAGPRVVVRVDLNRLRESLEGNAPRLGATERAGEVLGSAAAEERMRDSFRFNPDDEPTHELGGTLLETAVAADEATRMCDKFFDKKFDGACLLRIPDLEETRLGEEPFAVGVITGPSGSSKSVFLREHFGAPTEVAWAPGEALASHFASEEQAQRALGVVELGGLAGRTHDSLSSGQRELANLARLLDASQACVDEFTSCLDRALAKRVAGRLGRYLREHNPDARLVVVSCHTDVLGPLGADWVYDTVRGLLPAVADEQAAAAAAASGGGGALDRLAASGALSPDGSLRAPELALDLECCEPWLWALFREHHYKTKTLSQRARPFVLRHGDEMVGFVAAIRQVGSKHPSSHKRQKLAARPAAWRAHRTVVLPTWQGLGLGSRLSDACGELHRLLGCAYLAQTVHPRFGAYRDASPLWEATQFNHTVQTFRIDSWSQRLENVRVRLRTPRYIYAHAYMGPTTAADKAYLAARLQVVQDEAAQAEAGPAESGSAAGS